MSIYKHSGSGNILQIVSEKINHRWKKTLSFWPHESKNPQSQKNIC